MRRLASRIQTRLALRRIVEPLDVRRSDTRLPETPPAHHWRRCSSCAKHPRRSRCEPGLFARGDLGYQS